MPRFQVRNRVAKVILGEVIVQRPEDVLQALADETGADIEDIARALGTSVEEARAAIEIVEIVEAPARSARTGDPGPLPPRRAMFV
jgi:hypothetical protein